MKTLTITSVTLGTATGLLTSNATIPSDGDTVTIGTKVYTAKTTLGTTEGQVLIGGSAANFLTNLKAAINHTGTAFPSNTDYYCAAAHSQVSAGTLTATTLEVSALTPGLDGNAIATTETAVTLSWGAAALAGGQTATIAGTVSDEEFSAIPSQRVTVTEQPVLNPNWSRGIQTTSEAVFVKRNGVDTAAIFIDSVAAFGVAVVPALSFPPYIASNPDASATALATATVTSDATAPSDADTVTIGSKTYTFKTTLTPTEGEVLIGASAATALTNLKSAINHTGTPDTDYKCAAAHTQVTATTLTATTLKVVALVAGTGPNAYATTETSSHLAWGAATMSGGTAAATFSVTANSELAGTTYRWQESADGTTFADLADAGAYSGTATATLTVTPASTALNGYYYRCNATNSQGTTASAYAQLTVT